MLNSPRMQGVRQFFAWVKWNVLLRGIVGPHGMSAVSTSIPHGERTWEYPWVLKTVGSVGGSRLLDVGCGTVSVLPLWLSGLGYEVWGCDLRPTDREIAEVHFVQDDIVTTKAIPNGEFDIVTCISVIEHVGLRRYPGEKGKDVEFLASLERFLAPSGRLLLTLPFGKAAWSGVESNRIDACRIHDQESLTQLVKEAGFSVVQQDFACLKGGHWKPGTLPLASSLSSEDQVRALCGLVLRRAD